MSPTPPSIIPCELSSSSWEMCEVVMISPHKKSTIGGLAGVVIPLCSCAPRMVLKSPKNHQGMGCWLCRFSRSVQRFLLVKLDVEAYMADIPN